MPGLLVTFEGIDGCGKTSVARMVFEKLKQKGKNVALTQEPTTTWLGDAVKKGISENHPALTEAFLFMADRVSHTKQISQWLNEGKTVLCDRYSDSTICYQAASLSVEGFEIDPFEWLRDISGRFVLEPDLTILLDIKPETALMRIEPREKKTKFEKLEFLQKVRDNFLKLAEIEDRIEVVDAGPSLEEVATEVSKRIEKLVS